MADDDRAPEIVVVVVGGGAEVSKLRVVVDCPAEPAGEADVRPLKLEDVVAFVRGERDG